MSEIDQHQSALIDAFASLIRAEDAVAVIQAKIDTVVAQLEREKADAALVVRDSWIEIEKLMAETGEFSVTLPGSVTDYEIYRTTPRESVKVIDASAVPDAMCKTERKPKLKEIGDFLRVQARGGLPLPNWASLETGDSKLAWRAVKRKQPTT